MEGGKTDIFSPAQIAWGFLFTQDVDSKRQDQGNR